MTPSAAMQARVSTRAFLPRAVDTALVRAVLAAAGSAPSGTNTQPWQVHVVSGESRDRLCAAVTAAVTAPLHQAAAGYDYYPSQWRDPYLARRRACGFGLYGLLGIQKGDKAAMRAQELRNFALFDAPVGLFVFIDRDLGRGSLLDCGMFLQNLMLAAIEAGLSTCPQAAWVPYEPIVQEILAVPPTQLLVCGLALGYADPAALVNRFRPGRLDVEAYTTWHDGGCA